ncbi:MAG: TVP38/TMEM64 family protein [Leptolyngbya sp. SIO1D8]|nr:TVP38/TMEM64 family protein [Leptolyngbya sp. SIO1D8]
MNALTDRIRVFLNRRAYRLLRLSLLTMLAAWLLSTLPALAQEATNQASTGIFGQLQDKLVNALAWIDSLGAIAPIAFIILYVIVTVAFIPASIVTLGAGVVFGVVQGSLYVFIGAMLGAAAAFLVGRYLARDWVGSKIAGNDKFKAIDEAIANEGRKIIFLIRLSPAFPFNLLNYALGLTKVSLKDYVLGTTGILPGTVMYVYLGSLAGNLATLGAGDTPSNPVITWTIRIIAFVATVGVTVYVTRIARKALQESVPSIGDNSEVAVSE